MKTNIISGIFIISMFFLQFAGILNCGSMAGSQYKTIPENAPVKYKKKSPEDYAKRRPGRKGGFEGGERLKISPLKSKTSKRMIIYTADYIIIVNNVEKSMKDVESISNKYKGFIESAISSDSYRYARIIIRIPVKLFDAALKEIEELGSIKKKEVSASDITMEYSDLNLRVETARKVRARLYELLKRTKKIKDRVLILREIERLSTGIDALESRLKYLKNRAVYSTITLALKAKTQVSVSRYLPSPFPWIAGLNINSRSIYDSGSDITYEAPEGFFGRKEEYFYEKRNIYLFSTPGETTQMRMGVVKNYPPADLTFWEEAVKIDIKNRKYRLIKTFQIKGNAGDIFKVFTLKPSGTSIYVVAFTVKGEKILVFEARFSDLKEYKSHKDILFKFVKLLRFK